MLFMAATSLFGIGYLIYYGFAVSWWSAVTLFVIELAAFVILAIIGAFIPAWIVALTSFVTIPLLALYLMHAMPIAR